LIVRQWLEDFETSESRLVLDGEGEIQRDYQKKLGFNDYGRQVVQHKLSTSAVDLVNVDYDMHGEGMLEEPLQSNHCS
jgi:hypothetical protein